MNELKPEDVMRASECCADKLLTCPAKGCPMINNWDCRELLAENALAFLREKDAEIERLKQENKDLHDNTEVVIEMIADARDEAIDEFAERLKHTLIEGGILPIFVRNSIDKIAKEMKELKITKCNTN